MSGPSEILCRALNGSIKRSANSTGLEIWKRVKDGDVENVTATVWARVNELSVMFRRSIFLVMVVKLLGCQEGVRGGLRGLGMCLLLGYLGDGFGLQTEVREVHGHGGRVSQVWWVAQVSSGRVDMRWVQKLRSN